LVYASNFELGGKRLQSISVAAQKIGRLLKLPIHVVTFRDEFDPIYIYYKNGDNSPIPLYCDKEGETDVEKIYRVLRNMIFVLSFHPAHSALISIRKEAMQFS
jgi:hypothetical protein